jgi:predicted lipid-binding transport protein (Tim44 family)|tara:strand:- start:1213 stop:1632 length:420 start_codon:yes stop_codon:yes gene_type:complete
MSDPHDPRHNPAWQAARQWQARARQARPQGLLGTLKLLLIWLLFGAMMIVAMVLGLFFLLLGWALMPLLRYRLKKRMEKMRADQAEDIGSGFHYRETRYRETRGADGSYREQQVLEGDYVVKGDEARGDDPAQREPRRD